MTPVWLLAALCGTVLDLNPTGQQYDFLSYMVPPTAKTHHMTGKHPLYTFKTTDKVWQMKGDAGYPWDVNIYDESGIWAWTTENGWAAPTTYTRWTNTHQVLMAPRVVRGGYPGMRWFSCDSRYQPTTECGDQRVTHDLGGGIINELWGPYTRTPGWGNVGTFDELTLIYGYGCVSQSHDATASDSCSSIETSWWTKEYGLVRWALYQRDSTGAWGQTQVSEFYWLTPGAVAPYFPCDQ